MPLDQTEDLNSLLVCTHRANAKRVIEAQSDAAPHIFPVTTPQLSSEISVMVSPHNVRIPESLYLMYDIAMEEVTQYPYSKD